MTRYRPFGARGVTLSRAFLQSVVRYGTLYPGDPRASLVVTVDGATSEAKGTASIILALTAAI